MLNKLLTILLTIFVGVSNAQDIPIGSWRDHLPYSDAVSVSSGNGLIYCATNSAVFTYDKVDMIIDRLNLVNSLSDIGITKIKFNKHNNVVIIGYANGNIDILDENKKVTNLSFIKNSSIIGNKSINHIYLQGKLAYLSTSFGIVVIDTDRLEIVDTYFFGPLGNFIVTNCVAMDNQNIYAATDEGVFYADKNSSNLVDYNVWSLLPGLSVLKYSSIVSYSNRLFASLDLSVWDGDTLYYNDSGNWQKFGTSGVNIKDLNVSNNNLIVTELSSIKLYNSSLLQIENLYTVDGLFSISPNEAIMDSEGVIWYAENSHGLIKSKNNFDNEVITPNGPASSNVFNMDFIDGDLWKVAGGYNQSTFEALYDTENLINYRMDGVWENVGTSIKNINGGNAFDAVSVAIDPNNKAHVYVGSWVDGLFELNNGVVSNIFTAQNSSLDSTFFGTTGVGALLYDKDNNLWISSSSKRLNMITPDNSWYTFDFVNNGGAATSIEIDNDGRKWIGLKDRNGITVFDDNGTFDDLSDDQSVLLTSGSNEIPGSILFCITKDLDGEIWLGTNEGISVFYNPSQVFEQDIIAEQIFVQQDGQTQILLETEVVTTIAIDGTNRKWIGTQTSGVFLMSEDGTEQIEHFTTSNSPLFSNSIFDIVIDPKTGEVFFGTEKGLLSYKGSATEAVENFNNVFVYPNPVKPDFNGTIAIRGLIKDTDVRITDISGNIVYKTTSLGGQAVWDGKDFNGNKVQTGVYMIFNGSPQGQQKAAAKILIYH